MKILWILPLLGLATADTLFFRPYDKVRELTSPVVCPDQQSECPAGSTCCLQSGGQYGCCPLPKAVCCKDGMHCCPNGTKCNSAGTQCLSSTASFPSLLKTPAIKTKANNVTCPDGQSQCKTGETCCKLKSGTYGCCPLPDAVCCKDEKHCCSKGTKCEGTRCVRDGRIVMDQVKKVPAMTKAVNIRANNVTCPDGQSQCKTGETCCKLKSGTYGCCPLPDAVCCKDEKHCCSKGTKCEGTRCVRDGRIVMDQVKKVPAMKNAVKIRVNRNVVCPDQSECPNGQTCCQLANSGYGCCPNTDGVCCPDKLHCCPQYTSCDNGNCVRDGEVVIEQMSKLSAVKSVKADVMRVAANITCPDGQSTCHTGQTCCKLASGLYGCCPVPNAVCCSDHTHCCPHGTTCDTSTGHCNRGDNLVMDWFEKVPALRRISKEVVCPDGQSQCSDKETCCKLASGAYGCCPRINAVCCEDHKHCCPEGTTCETSKGRCMRQDNSTITWLEKVLARKTEDKGSLSSVVCPDGQSECKSGQTCCKLTSGGYGCCPIPSAVCCEDGEHCCPSGYTCDNAQHKCNKNEGTSVMMRRLRTAKNIPHPPPHSVMCPDGQSECMDGQTCCLLEDQTSYGCCPIEDAVCCLDHIHCCPQGTTCDIADKKCIGSRQKFEMIITEMMTTQPARKVSLEYVICPDKSSQCPTGQTCCPLVDGHFGCCPTPNAVCCSDRRHCCLAGSQCDVRDGKCIKADNSVTNWLEKVPAQKVEQKEEKPGDPVVCPGNQFQCEYKHTCCKLDNGTWACCPLQEADCCADQNYCCPVNTQCNTAQGKCTAGDTIVMDWFVKVPAKPVSTPGAKIAVSKEVICPDKQSQCKEGQTCCKLSSGKYGCCPLKEAVCCSDEIHCCPKDTTCEPSSGKCQRGDGLVMDWFLKLPAQKMLTVSDNNVICPDGRSACPNGQTCCKTNTGAYGCCPLPQAVCCADHLHCCPHGYSCNNGRCQRGDKFINWLEKLPSEKIITDVSTSVQNVVCPDGQSECHDGQTCCKLASGNYGCCPSKDAVCCADHVHCCPHGTTCSTGGCTHGNKILDWLEKLPSKKLGPVVPVTVQNIVCPDQKSMCPNGNTCCQLASGQYGCCPKPNAVCCADHIHCCPEGTTCDVSSGKCNKGNNVIDWLEKLPSKKLTSDVSVSTKKVICPDGQSQCNEGSTCCKLASGQYGCCPQPNAVCCADHVHCCPHDYTCDVSSGHCTKGNNVIAWLEKLPSTKLITDVSVSTQNVICPDGQSQCKDGSTCCKLASGQYGCCPIPKAVCCSDHVHCCPHDYKCDVSSGKCMKGNNLIDWLEKLPSMKVTSEVAVTVQNIVCPDGQSECKEGSTCCKLASGQYGCCPKPNAVCCADHVHCCPQGYTCDVSAGTCQKKGTNQVIDWSEKLPAMMGQDKNKTIPCPDKNMCPEGFDEEPHCCQFGNSPQCCIYKNGLCCSVGGKNFCCPPGYICDEGAEICRMPDGTKQFKNTANLFIQKLLKERSKV
uniref:Granulin epithelin variant 1 n=2 Tax=Pinctada fucata TaxID=50426 RepID=A0A0B4ZW94_PINFU|nr:granulin epithelin precursor variant 1 [Pinctada fucata]